MARAAKLARDAERRYAENRARGLPPPPPKAKRTHPETEDEFLDRMLSVAIFPEHFFEQLSVIGKLMYDAELRIIENDARLAGKFGQMIWEHNQRNKKIRILS